LKAEPSRIHSQSETGNEMIFLMKCLHNRTFNDFEPGFP
jgi:hypothetical protein